MLDTYHRVHAIVRKSYEIRYVFYVYEPHGPQADFVRQVRVVVQQGDEQETGERVHGYAVPVHAQAQATGRATVQQHDGLPAKYAHQVRIHVQLL